MIKGGRGVEEKISLPPSETPLYTMVLSDLVEVEEKSAIFFSDSAWNNSFTVSTFIVSAFAVSTHKTNKIIPVSFGGTQII